MDSGVLLSVPRVRVVRGIEVRRMPLGRYLEALEEVAAFPEELISRCFPDMGMSEMMERFSRMDEGLIRQCINGAVVGAPRAVVGLVARLLDVPVQKLMDDPEIGPDGLLEIVNVMLEVNSLGKLVEEAMKLREYVTKLGYKSL